VAPTLSEDCKKFWEQLLLDKKVVGLKVAEPLKLLLQYYGYDNQQSISELTDADLDEIQEDARTRFDSPAERIAYLGTQASHPHKFTIFSGFRKTLHKVVKMCQSRNFLGKDVTAVAAARAPRSCAPPPADEDNQTPSSQVAKVIERLCASGLKAAADRLDDGILSKASSFKVVVDPTNKKAHVHCPACDAATVITRPDHRNSWVVSNFITHAKKMHPSQRAEEERQKKKVEDKRRKRSAPGPSPLADAFKRSAARKLFESGADPDDPLPLVDLDCEGTGSSKEKNNATNMQQEDSAMDVEDNSAQDNEGDSASKSGGDFEPGSDTDSSFQSLLRSLREDQTFLTNFFSFVAARPEQQAEVPTTAAPSTPPLPVGCGSLLERMLEAAKANQGRHKNGLRFEREDKMFFTYLYIQGGRKMYETLQANAPKSIPSLSTVLKWQGRVMEPVQEGQCRWEELSKYLDDEHLPRIITVSEDGTRITGQIEYDCKSNLLVGFAPPLDSRGLPDTSGFLATGEKAMEAMFDKAPRAHTAYVLMAQPMKEGAAPFCLMAYGTDNRFHAEDAVRRWRWLKEEAERFGIAVIAFSADGDPKMLRGMRYASRPAGRLPNNPDAWSGFFDQDLDSEVCFVQDTVHIGTKFRTGFCHRGKSYIMGNYCASVVHLDQILENTTRLEHGLRSEDLDHTDKMNFDAVLRITDERVRQLLRGPGKEEFSGTEMFLTVVRDVLEAFLAEQLPAEDRIYSIWRAVFFLRIWREWLIQNDHPLDQCFITTNTFQSVELNAHALVKLVRILRDGAHPEVLIPHLIGSQPCEQLFRALRSLTTTHVTVCNFSMQKMLARLRRIELQCRVVSSVGETFTFPREEKKSLKAEQAAAMRGLAALPSDGVILQKIDQARSDAKDCAALLGMDAAVLAEHCPAPSYGDRALNLDVDDSEDAVGTGAVAVEHFQPPEEPDDFDPDDVALLCASQAWAAGREVRAFPEESPMMLFTKPNGVKVPIRKSTYCWLRAKGSHRLSSDRLQRVMQDNTRAAPGNREEQQEGVVRRDTVAVGDWCAFRKAGEERLRVGRILAFRYATGEGRKRLYTLLTAPVEVPDGVEARGLRVLYSWFGVDEERRLHHITSDEECDIEAYAFSIPSPVSAGRGVMKLICDI
ncbi:hypothetical protein KUF71_018020, partial [Frankliniella fusca]